jgi:hypothetical protein
MNFKHIPKDVLSRFYYDETSPSCIRHAYTLRNGKKVIFEKDSPALSMDTDGYYQCKVDKVKYRIHRIIYCMFYGYLPSNCLVDHKDGNRANNKIDNLRLVTYQINSRNKAPSKDYAPTGVTLKRSKGKLMAWKATWKDINGTPREKSFSIQRYGEEFAFFAACECRDLMISRLNLLGAGYSENHGQPREFKYAKR